MGWDCTICGLDCDTFDTPQQLAAHLVAWHDEWLVTRQVPWHLWAAQQEP